MQIAKVRDSTLNRFVTIRMTVTTEQRIDVQGHSMSTTFVAIESPHNDFQLVISCHQSSISLASRSRKPPYPILSPPPIKWNPFEFRRQTYYTKR